MLNWLKSTSCVLFNVCQSLHPGSPFTSWHNTRPPTYFVPPSYWCFKTSWRFWIFGGRWNCTNLKSCITFAKVVRSFLSSIVWPNSGPGPNFIGWADVHVSLGKITMFCTIVWVKCTFGENLLFKDLLIVAKAKNDPFHLYCLLSFLCCIPNVMYVYISAWLLKNTEHEAKAGHICYTLAHNTCRLLLF